MPSMLRHVPQAMEGNLFGAALTAPHDLVSLHVSAGEDSQLIACDIFRVELRLNLCLQLVARFEGPLPRGGGQGWGGSWGRGGGRRWDGGRRRGEGDGWRLRALALQHLR